MSSVSIQQEKSLIKAKIGCSRTETFNFILKKCLCCVTNSRKVTKPNEQQNAKQVNWPSTKLIEVTLNKWYHQHLFQCIQINFTVIPPIPSLNLKIGVSTPKWGSKGIFNFIYQKPLTASFKISSIKITRKLCFWKITFLWKWPFLPKFAKKFKFLTFHELVNIFYWSSY